VKINVNKMPTMLMNDSVLTTVHSLRMACLCQICLSRGEMPSAPRTRSWMCLRRKRRGIVHIPSWL